MREAQYTSAREACEGAAVSQGLVRAPSPPDDRLLTAQYEAFQITEACLARHSYPTSERPSISAYLAARGANWHPFDAAAARGQDLVALEVICPSDLVTLLEVMAGERPD